jgi:hypothetical protein
VSLSAQLGAFLAVAAGYVAAAFAWGRYRRRDGSNEGRDPDAGDDPSGTREDRTDADAGDDPSGTREDRTDADAGDDPSGEGQ